MRGVIYKKPPAKKFFGGTPWAFRKGLKNLGWQDKKNNSIKK
jgi:hypothetical protein